MAPMLEAVELGVLLGFSAFSGSWNSLGQTHARTHVGERGTKAKLCIYLKALLEDSRSMSSPAATTGEPNGGSIWMARPAPAVRIENAGAAVHWLEQLEAVEFAFRLWSAWAIGIVGEEEDEEQMWEHQQGLKFEQLWLAGTVVHWHRSTTRMLHAEVELVKAVLGVLR